MFNRLILYDIPFGLNDLIIDNNLQKKITHPVLYKHSFINAKQLNQRIQSFKLNHFSTPKFWQVNFIKSKLSAKSPHVLF